MRVIIVLSMHPKVWERLNMKEKYFLIEQDLKREIGSMLNIGMNKVFVSRNISGYLAETPAISIDVGINHDDYLETLTKLHMYYQSLIIKAIENTIYNQLIKPGLLKKEDSYQYALQECVYSTVGTI